MLHGKKFNRGMDKENMLHLYNGILFSHKKEWNWVICWDMYGPKDSLTNEASHKKKKKYYLVMHMYRILKNDIMNLFTRHKFEAQM